MAKTQIIEDTKLIKFLDEKILFAKGSGKTKKANALTRCREIMYHYYENEPGFMPKQTETEVDLFGEETVDLFD